MMSEKTASREERSADSAIRFGSVCSGIEAASVAWEPLGFLPQWFAEIEPFPSAVLAHRFPHVPNLGDFTKIGAGVAAIDLLVGGTPCQSFSIAGLRGGLADDRGNLALEFLRLADRLRPKWLVFENVPGVLSSTSHDAPDPRPPPPPLDLELNGQEVETEDEYSAEELHAFNCLLAGFSELGYGYAYGVLDAQYFGVPQRRNRVFVIGYLGDWRPAAAVLVERESLQGNPPPSRALREEIAGTLGGGSGARGWADDLDRAGAFIPETSHWSLDLENLGFGGNIGHRDAREPTITLNTNGNIGVAHSLRGEGFDASEDGTGRGTPLVATPILEVGGGSSSRGAGPNGAGIGDPGDPMFTLQRGKQHAVALQPQAFRSHMGGDPSNAMNLSDQSPTLDSNAPAVLAFDTTQITSAENRCNPQPGEPCHPLAAGAHAPAIAYGMRSDAARDGRAKTPSVDAAGRSRLRDPGFNVIEEGAPTIDAGAPPIAFHMTQDPISGSQVPALGAHSGGQGVAGGVRRLTPRECERLQGFPDDWTLVPFNGKPAADGNRYRAIGNSMAIPCMAWLGRRIQRVHSLLHERVSL